MCSNCAESERSRVTMARRQFYRSDNDEVHSERLRLLDLSPIIIGHVAFSFPFVTVVVRARMEGFDRSLEEASKDLGASDDLPRGGVADVAIDVVGRDPVRVLQRNGGSSDEIDGRWHAVIGESGQDVGEHRAHLIGREDGCHQRSISSAGSRNTPCREIAIGVTRRAAG